MKRLKLKPKIGTGKQNELNIFNSGSLLSFETKCWQATKRVPKSLLKEEDDERKNWLRQNKSLINRKKLADLHAYITEARKVIETHSLPFPLNGVYLIPNDKVELVNNKLNNIKSQFYERVGQFTAQIEEYIQEAERTLGSDYFNRADYPRDIQSKFYMGWRFFELTLPSNITQELYEEENKKFRDMMEETRKMGIMALREGFAEIITHLTDALTERVNGQEKKIKQVSIDKITEFFSEFQSKNIFKDQELESLAKKAKEIVKGVSIVDLKEDKDLEKLINKQLGDVKKELDKSTEVFRRKLML